MELLNLENYKAEIHRTLISKLDLEKLSRVNSSQARQAVSGLVKEIMSEQRVPLNFDEQEKIHADLLDEVFGLGRCARRAGRSESIAAHSPSGLRETRGDVLSSARRGLQKRTRWTVAIAANWRQAL